MPHRDNKRYWNVTLIKKFITYGGTVASIGGGSYVIQCPPKEKRKDFCDRDREIEEILEDLRLN